MTGLQQCPRIILQSLLYCRVGAFICLHDVLDTGAGIDPEIMERLFAEFATKAHNGTGLRLYLSKTIIRPDGGKIWAENNKERRKRRHLFIHAAPSISQGIKRDWN
jgi:K+-sensing histidine kinase KdpD